MRPSQRYSRRRTAQLDFLALGLEAVNNAYALLSIFRTCDYHFKLFPFVAT